MTPINITHDALGFNVDIVPVMGTSLSPPHADSMLAMIRAKLGTNHARKPYKLRRTSLGTLLKQAAKAGKSVKGAEVYPDRTVLQFGEPEPAEPDNPWPLDEFRTKETKQ
jgi:hypothetical protein